MRADVYLLHNSGGSGLRSIEEELERSKRAGGVRRRRHGGAVHREEWERELEFRINR